jgi:transcriptional antiterminator NusG
MDTGEHGSEQTTLAAERAETLPEPSPLPGEIETTEIVASEAAEEMPLAEATEEARLPETTEGTPPAELAEEAPLAEVTEEASAAEATEEAPHDEMAEEAPLAEVTEQAPLAEVSEEASPAEVVEEQADSGEGPEETEEEIVDDRAWYVIHCYSGYESKVKHNLEQRIETMQMQDKIFQVVVPTEDEIEVRDGKRRVVERRVFPGYILVQLVLTDDSWYVVRNTPGVTGFVGMGNEPTPLRPEEVQAILKRMEAEAPKVKVTYKPGQKVRIVDGPFNEFIGVVDDIDMERAKVRVMVSFFGRETPVELDFLQVEKA